MRNYERVNGKLKPEDVECIVQAVVASNRLEGMVMASEEVDMLRKYVSGDVMNDEYVVWAQQYAGV